MTPADQHKWRFPRVYRNWLDNVYESHALISEIADHPADFDTGFQDQLVELDACWDARLRVRNRGARECWDTWDDVFDMEWLALQLVGYQAPYAFSSTLGHEYTPDEYRQLWRPKFYRRQP